jgi:glycosyltransferase involved in cell wall biosynthesis
MKFSIITPTHSAQNLPFLLELYDSICEQTYTDWEWVLYINGEELQFDSIPRRIKSNARVKIYKTKEENSKIGFIKNKAFNLGTGEILVEVDHDDILLPNCLEELKKAFEDPEIGFVYSDSITYRMNGGIRPYNTYHGWKWQTMQYRDKECISHYHFEPSSHALSYIWYAPDHVRAWRSVVYKQLGGHNEEYDVCDDQELCIRTYLHTKMKLIKKPLYVYRITGDNTWLERNKKIQNTTRELFLQYSRKLAEKDADDKNLLKIDLGGGINPMPGYKIVDQRPHADYVCDLENGIPLPDNSVGVLNASHMLEHLKNPIESMREIHRVLAHGGWAFIEVPSTDGRGAWQDPTHVSFWNQNSFFYYTRKDQARFIDNYNIRFSEMWLDTHFPSSWWKENDIPVTRAILVAVKNEDHRYPGYLAI